MPDLATVGIIVTAEGARREIALTREELIKLANGGKEASAVMRTVVPPQVVPQMRSVTTVTERSARVSQDASLHFGRMRGALTQVALSASGIPGPLGRVASVLSQFTVGGGVTVGVLAGITALSFAWKEFTKDADAARAMMEKIHAMESGFSPEAQKSRLRFLEGREAALSKQLQAAQSIEGGGIFGAVFGEFLSRDIAKELDVVRERMAALGIATAKTTRDFQGFREAAELRLLAPRILSQAGLDADVGRIGTREWWNPNATNEATALAARNSAQLNTDMQVATALRTLTGQELIAKGLILSIEKQITDAKIEQARVMGAGNIRQQQIAGAQQHIGNWAIGFASRAAGPFGGMVSGVGTNLMSGNLYGAAAAGVTGLIDGLMGLGGAAREAAERMRAVRLQFQAWSDSVALELGEISAGEAAARNAQRELNAQRGALFGRSTMTKEEADYIAGILSHTGKLSPEIQRMLDEINRREQELINHRREEADEVERLNNAIRNAPSGFFVQRYLRRLGYDPGEPGSEWPGSASPRRRIRRGAATGSRGGVVIENVNINGNRSGTAMLQDFVAALRVHQAATVGPDAPLASALDYVN